MQKSVFFTALSLLWPILKLAYSQSAYFGHKWGVTMILFQFIAIYKYSSFVASCLVMKAKSANKTLIMYEQRKSHIFTSNRHKKEKRKREVLSSSSSSSECKVDRMRRSRDSRGRWWAQATLGGIQFFRQTKESRLRSLSKKICLNHSAKKKKE